MHRRLAYLNLVTQVESLDWLNDRSAANWYIHGMAPRHDWYLKEWLRALSRLRSDVIRLAHDTETFDFAPKAKNVSLS